MRFASNVPLIALSAMLLVSCGSDDGDTHNTAADASPDASQPDGSTTDGSPDGAAPDGTVPEGSAPDTAAPDGGIDSSPESGLDGAAAVCGDKSCDVGEDCDSCPEDCGECPPGTLESSVSQYGMTWTFDKPYPCGQFATGDWWCVGPLTVSSVTPAPTGTRNGSMLNPVGSQGYDARAGKYDGATAVSFPLDMSPPQSLVSSISHPDASACTQGGSPGWNTYDGSCQRGPIATQAVFTVLASPPAPGTFRPPYAGDSKPLHRLSKVAWSALPNLPAPSNAPAGDKVLRHVERPWIDHLNSWTMQHGCATLNMYCYGREVGDVVSTVSQFVLLDTPERDDVAIRLIQVGIDNYGVLQGGGGWGADGGHFNGRKWPIVFAGVMLGEAAMRSPGVHIGNEDRMTYFGANGKALWGRDCNDCYFSNGCEYSGSCTNGAKDCRDPAHLVDGCSGYRNCCTSHTWVGTSLAARILGAKSDWGNDAFFDYIDRWMSGDVPGGGNTTSAFVTEMWNTYHDNLPNP
jgi:hypothetical protein